jgi:hypothetical protein
LPILSPPLGAARLSSPALKGRGLQPVNINAKRIDVFATALFHEMRVVDLSDLDLSYTPPLSGPWDPVQLATQRWEQAAHETPVRAVNSDAAS